MITINYQIKIVPAWLSYFLESRNLNLDQLTKPNLNELLSKSQLLSYTLLNEHPRINYFLPKLITDLDKSINTSLDQKSLFTLGLANLNQHEQQMALLYGDATTQLYKNVFNNQKPNFTIKKIGYEYLFFIVDPTNKYDESSLIDFIMDEIGTHYQINQFSYTDLFKNWLSNNTKVMLSLTNTM